MPSLTECCWNAVGYALGVILEACTRYQSGSGSSHADPVYVSAHFLRATNVGIGQVRVKLLKSGKTFTNILAELVQQVRSVFVWLCVVFLRQSHSDLKGTTRITAHLLFGDLSPSQPGRGQKVLAPPSPYARRVPLHSHPSTVTYDAVRSPWARKMETRVSVDTVLLSHNDPTSATRTTAESVGGGGVEWGAWYELAHKDDKLTTSSMPFFCDSFVNLPILLPASEPGSMGDKKRLVSSKKRRHIDWNTPYSWFPTIAMTIEFKARVPSSDYYSARTVGLYSESRFQTNPEGRHNARVEVWTAPSEIGQGDVAKGWRVNQYCIAVADQMALMLPVELNIRQGTKASAKL
ncbi:thioesterase-like superfamily-domain-containing protein [Butyriboletus roseoflavus]|nr:thioesterase-like superfamily-domain-containing protein [Butyriboletus roseoflavus]